jgi:hypothetical protein
MRIRLILRHLLLLLRGRPRRAASAPTASPAFCRRRELELVEA